MVFLRASSYLPAGICNLTSGLTDYRQIQSAVEGVVQEEGEVIGVRPRRGLTVQTYNFSHVGDEYNSMHDVFYGPMMFSSKAEVDLLALEERDRR